MIYSYCKCGCPMKYHTDNDFYKSTISSCSNCIKSHWYKFTPDNLKYLEECAEKKGLVDV